MLVQKLEQYRKETSQRKRLDEIHLKVELLRYKLKERKNKMYGKKMSSPKKKPTGLSAKQKTLPKSLQKKIVASKGKKK